MTKSCIRNKSTSALLYIPNKWTHFRAHNTPKEFTPRLWSKYR